MEKKNETFFLNEASILQKFLNRKISFNNFYNSLILGKNCSTLISKSSAQGIVFKTCGDNNNGSCEKCKLKLAIKIYSIGDEGRHEYSILKEIKKAFQKQFNQTLKEAYMKRVIDYKIFLGHEKSTILVTRFVEFSKDYSVNMKKYLMGGKCSVLTLDCLIIEVLFTLQYLHNNIPGFVHFDLLTQQIFLTPVITDEWLPFPNDIARVFLPRARKYRGLLGDFGYSITNNNKLNKYLDFTVRTIGFDVYRFLNDILNKCKSTSLESRAKFWILKALPNYERILKLSIKFAIESKKDTHGYLPKEAESLLPKSVGEIFSKFFPLQIKKN